MKPNAKFQLSLPLLVAFAALLPGDAWASNNPARDEAVTKHVTAIEESANRPFEQLARDFEDERFGETFKSVTTEADRHELLLQIAGAVAQSHGLLLSEEDDLITMTVEGLRVHRITFRIEPDSPYKILDLTVSESPQQPTVRLSLEGLDPQLRALEQQGLSGVVRIKIDGEVLHHEAYGIADPEAGRPTAQDSIYCIGSRPITFTVAAAYLLEQRELLHLDDSIANHFENVPADKQSITLRYLMTGRSGLPDFPAKPGDWDADLAWIDRAEFERRTWSEPLLFAPGSQERHSHWAFGLLAAVIERVSGLSYYDFLRRNFLDPAGMTRTGEYGERRHTVFDFAVGGGPDFVGLPNIPPNWGPTSWLVKGSGGMYSTAEDLARFYHYVRSGAVLGQEYMPYFTDSRRGYGGSARGYENFNSYDEGGSDEVFLLTNSEAGPSKSYLELTRALGRLVDEH